MTCLQLRTADPADTRRLAATVAGALRPGDVVSLTGELGAGKTCFVQGAAPALGVADRITSPSFVLRRDYRGDLATVLHLDVYRLDTLGEVLDLGYEEVAEGERITFIEWGDAMSQLLPADHLEVELRLGDLDAVAFAPPADEPEAEVRHVTIHAHGDDWARRLPGLAVDLQPWRAEA
ncbi:MAG: tRNA (adenosine(37)-N6)-threonylcarbamoyltransferase complex ATPase subunit type 1 TsaE [Euzebyales bacterium]|nr:tRNA (adenosine(37)-N6)-threonylcarbamoyltransferase complex ATPase subunit type 1 TsaE [Euzebyales bacterium]